MRALASLALHLCLHAVLLLSHSFRRALRALTLLEARLRDSERALARSAPLAPDSRPRKAAPSTAAT
eukprot:3947921-Prymnesium_polylepis.1